MANALQLETLKTEVTTAVAIVDKFLRLCTVNEAAIRNMQSVLNLLHARNTKNEAALAAANAKIKELVSETFMIITLY